MAHAVPEDVLAKLGPLKLLAGIPVGDRSVTSYLTRPLTDQIARAFRKKNYAKLKRLAGLELSACRARALSGK